MSPLALESYPQQIDGFLQPNFLRRKKNYSRLFNRQIVLSDG